MRKNLLYQNEIASAHKFIVDHNVDASLNNFLREMERRTSLTHSDRWSLCFDFLSENYPEATGTIVTGLTYWLES